MAKWLAQWPLIVRRVVPEVLSSNPGGCGGWSSEIVNFPVLYVNLYHHISLWEGIDSVLYSPIK